MRDKLGAQFFSVGVDEETYLGDDGEPNVVGADCEVVVRAVGLDCCPNKAVLRGADGGCFGLCGEGGLK